MSRGSRDQLDGITVRMWSPFSRHYIQAAVKLARLSGDLETTHKAQSSPELLVEHRAYVMASVLTAVAFLEATINELFAQAADGSLSGVNTDATGLMANMWGLMGHGRRMMGTLDKYQLALILAKKQPFDKGGLPYQDVQLVIDLRNTLVHYVPQWATAGTDADLDAALNRVGKSLRTKKFTLNPFAAKGNPFFPDKCLSHGCAKWAVHSSVKFADEFFSRLGLSPSFGDVRSAFASI
jgi:hypothetical protein